MKQEIGDKVQPQRPYIRLRRPYLVSHISPWNTYPACQHLAAALFSARLPAGRTFPLDCSAAARSSPKLEANITYDLRQLGFHSVTARWFQDRFPEPTPPQRDGWPKIQAGLDTLIAAPTGSGKTLTSFLVCIDKLLRESLEGNLVDETRVLYISPLKALSNDIRKNLEMPLLEIQEAARALGPEPGRIRAMVRTGDTPPYQRQQMTKKPPHILVTTPESLYLLLTSDKGRGMLKTVQTVIVDEIHALARDKRGAHLALSLERLDALCGRRPLRIGLSATQKPIEDIAAFLVGAKGLDAEGKPRCEIVNSGHKRTLDLAIEVPKTELGAVCSNEQWEEVYAHIKEMVETHKSTLIFVNTRKLAERVAFHLSQHLGEDKVASHHGSLSKDRRLSAEERLKAGQLKVIVATASLELGIDIGSIDLVCQIGSPKAIATFLQRVGRAGHSVGAVPKGRLFALTRDELIEATALIKAVRDGMLDKIEMPKQPLDILAQQIVAEVSAQETSEVALYDMMRGAYPYRDLDLKTFEDVISMLAAGYAQGKRNGAYLHRDQMHGLLRARRGARITAATSGGAIPEQGDFRVINEGDGSFVGTINEDFAIETSKGDVFLLGTTSWQVMQLRGTDLVVVDANGAPPTIPFWLGEAPGRTIELSNMVSQIRTEVTKRITLPEDRDDPLFQLDALAALRTMDPEAYRAARLWLETEAGADSWASLQMVHYIAVQKVALGLVPTQEQVVFERFFDDTGGMQLVIHAPYGMRINKGWGLALRKRFCRSFDFELQASADNDGIVLSLGPHQSFPIEQLFTFLNERNIKGLIEQALLQVPLFQVRWRWNTTRSLAVLRNRNGQRVPPALQRFRADDLMTSVFPAQTMCKEHITGDIELPDHPLVNQTMHDCLHEAIDLTGLTALMGRIERGEVELIARDTREPSPFAYQLLNAYPYAFLDDAPLEERRARAVATRRSFALDSMNDLAKMEPEFLNQVSRDAWPQARNADELHDVLEAVGALPEVEAKATQGWPEIFDALVADGRACRLVTKDGTTLWIAAEGLDLAVAAYGDSATVKPAITLPAHLRQSIEPEAARLAILRGYLEIKGVVAADDVAHALGLSEGDVLATLPALEDRGDVVRGRFTDRGVIEWCERRLLMRIHRLTLDGLRRQIKPVSVEEFHTFLLKHHKMIGGGRREGRQGVLEALAQLAGFDAAAGGWENEILAARVKDYQSSWLDDLTHSGQIAWGRLAPPKKSDDDDASPTPSALGMSRTVPLALMPREDLAWLLPPDRASAIDFARANARAVYEALEKRGAQFFAELKLSTGLLETQLEEALGELARLGLIHADGFSAIRPFVSKSKKLASKSRFSGPPSRFRIAPTYALGGRWALFPGIAGLQTDVDPEVRIERWARLLLKRYGVVFRDLLTRESAAPTWGALARTFRRLEARGEVRGGRFVAGAWGEQFALAEAVDALRQIRDQGPTGEWIAMAVSDPLNLIGILTPGPKLASNRQTVVVLADGRVIATREGQDITFQVAVPLDQERTMRTALQLNGIFRTRMTTEPLPFSL